MIIPRSLALCGLLLVTVGCERTQVESESELETLSVYASPDSDMLVSVRPSEIVSSSLYELAARDQSQTFLDALEVDPADVSQVVLMLPTPDATSGRYFSAIANQLQRSKGAGVAGFGGLYQLNQRSPLQGMAAMVQFESAKSLEDVKTLIEKLLPMVAEKADLSMLPNVEYRVVELRDRRFLCASNEAFPAVLELNDRSFIICELKQMREGFERQFTTNPWLKSFTDEELAADFLIASQADGHTAKMGPLQAVGSPKRFVLACDLQGPSLATSRIYFKSPTDAKVSARAINSLYKAGKQALKQRSSLLASKSLGDWQLAKQFVEMYDSITISAKGPVLSIKVPRPHNFEKLVSRIADFDRSSTRNVSKKKSPFGI